MSDETTNTVTVPVNDEHVACPHPAETPVPENRDSNRQLPAGFIAQQFQPGQSGNPGGRPKSKPVSDELEKLMSELTGKGKNQQTIAKAIAKAMIAQARKGNSKVLALLLDRLEGKVADKLEAEVNGQINLIVDI